MSSCCNTLVYVEQSADFESNPEIQNFVYGVDGPLQATYVIVNVYDLKGNVIGNTRYDTKIVSIPGSKTATVTGVTQLTNESGNKDFVYTIGTRQFQVVAGQPKLIYSNVTVQKLVVDGVTYDFGDYLAVPIPGSTNEFVTIEY